MGMEQRKEQAIIEWTMKATQKKEESAAFSIIILNVNKYNPSVE